MRCNFRFTTYEIVEREELRVVKRNGAREPFNRDKLMSGLTKACEKRPVRMEQLEQVVDEISNELEEEGYREIPSSVIGAKMMRQLEAIDHVAYDPGYIQTGRSRQQHTCNSHDRLRNIRAKVAQQTQIHSG